MFLVEYKKGQFINIILIDWISISVKSIKFTLPGDSENFHVVEAEYQSCFVNSLQAINDSIHGDIEKAYVDANAEDR